MTCIVPPPSFAAYRLQALHEFYQVRAFFALLCVLYFSVLNKITPEKYDELFEQMWDVHASARSFPAHGRLIAFNEVLFFWIFRLFL